MKKWQTCLLGVGSICCLAACSAKNMSDESTMKEQSKTEQVSSQTATKGQAVADFELTGVDSKTYRLSDYKGKKVYLKFWASWCSICLASLPDTDEIAKDAGDDYVVLTVVSPGHKGEQAEADFKNWYKGLDYKNFPARIFAAAFSTGKILSFTPGGVASFKPLFSISLLTTSSSTTIMRETFSFPAQRLAT